MSLGGLASSSASWEDTSGEEEGFDIRSASPAFASKVAEELQPSNLESSAVSSSL